MRAVPAIDSSRDGPADANVDASIVSSAVVPGMFALWQTVAEGSGVQSEMPIDYGRSPQQFLKAGGVPGEIVERDVMELRSSPVDELQSMNAVAYFAALVEHFVSKYTLQVHRSWRQTAYVTFTELHCPRRRGAVATLQSSASTTGAFGLEIRILGMHGGDGRSATVKIASSLEARDGRCYRVSLPVDFLIEECSFRRDLFGRNFHHFFRVTPENYQPGFRQDLIGPPCPDCSQGEARDDDVVIRYDRAAAREEELAHVELAIEKNRRAKAGMKFEIPAVSTAVDLVGEVATTDTAHYRYQLPGGADYRAYRPPWHPFYYWLVT